MMYFINDPAHNKNWLTEFLPLELPHQENPATNLFKFIETKKNGTENIVKLVTEEHAYFKSKSAYWLIDKVYSKRDESLRFNFKVNWVNQPSG